ncbi:hypothetical protein B0A49_11949 [Cryomyces minteri]|uniref:Uncharacterized protein n=2 Tax=Cryomyces minteri TaxID=331657 RepID=A0A4U0X554_9PEZI|nr:hypothetical protein B0A49_11949 [Cryomyces minteri]
MGNDGGSIPTRRELVKEALRNPTTTELKETQNEQQEFHWSTDPLSKRPLSRPVVSDSSGNLYSKDSILEFLLPSEDGSSKAEADSVLQGAVNSLRDVIEVKFEVDVEARSRSNGSARVESWICPITNKTLGPGVKAVYLVPCGHAFSDSAIKEVSGETCPQCNEPYASNDVIPILPTAPADIARLALRAKTLRVKGLTHSLKKASSGGKKRKNNAADTELKSESLDVDAVQTKPRNGVRQYTTQFPDAASLPSSGIKDPTTASIAAKVLEEQELYNKRRKTENENLRSLFSSRDSNKPSGKSSDFMTRGFSIPANPKR